VIFGVDRRQRNRVYTERERLAGRATCRASGARQGSRNDPEALLFQAPHKAGQVASRWPAELNRSGKPCAGRPANERSTLLGKPGALRLREPYLDWYKLSRDDERR
jgi:hypothetical protein